MDCALALAKQGHPIQSVCLALGVARSNVCERLTRPEDWHDKRKQTNKNPEADALLVEAIRGVIAESPMYCYRSVARQINGARDEQGLGAVNHKRIYRVMKAHGLLRSRGGKHGAAPAAHRG